MFVVFDVTVDGQTEDVSEMSFSPFFAFGNERDVKTSTEKLQILLPVSYKDISGINYKNYDIGVSLKRDLLESRKVN
jgi:hypothetical protein